MFFLIICIIVLIMFGIYLLVKERGVTQVVISMVCSVPSGIALGFLSITLMCNASNDPYCEWNIILTVPVAVLALFLILTFIPSAIFKPVSGFIIAATIPSIIIFNLGFSLVTLSAMMPIVFSGILGAFVGNTKFGSPIEDATPPNNFHIKKYTGYKKRKSTNQQSDCQSAQ